MKQNKQLIRCLKKKLYGGRGLFSRAVDYIALRAIVFMGCYMWFSAMVANDPPHKKIADGVKADVRYEMTRLALENHYALEPCDLELKRQGKSYTVDTLKILHEMYPEDRIFCIVGADMLLSIDTWHNAPELLKRAEFIAVGRPDSGGEAAMNEKVKALEADYGAKV